jgi:biopolymer transport protein ExbD
MRRNKLYEDQKAEADMTPMLDIVFILLIFFIVTTSFVKEQGFLVNKPDGGKSENNNPILLIKINDSGIVSLNNRITDIERLPANIENFLATNTVSTAVVIPSYDTNYDKVVKVIDQINMVGGLTVSIGK